ncbi:MAG: S41 family peptidase [Candidatus Kerfeldbacteria bacterium]|nr:S41 family peptidase [Candidatus Kerfeldbacteria bacterium]
MATTFRSNRRAIVVLGLLVSFAIGVFVGRLWPAGGTPEQRFAAVVERLTKLAPGADVSALGRTWELIQSRYVKRPVDSTELIRGAIEGMVRSLNDPYSFYLNPEEAADFEDEINGKFEGIGAELGLKDNQLVVIAPLPQSPAERAGLRPRDSIVRIDSSATEAMSLEEAVSRIRGQEGTTVTLMLERERQPLTVSIRRERIQIKSVTLAYRSPRERQVAVVTISSFTQSSTKEFSQAVQDILVRQPAGIVVDLRNNTGGYLDAAVSVADAWLRDGPIVIEDFGNGQRDDTMATPDAPLGSYRLVVLINGGTASAAEILAGALHDRLHTPLVGERSFGKGSVQEIQDLSDGSTLKLTVAHWLTPNGQSIDGVGIDPSEPVPAPEAGITADHDPQLERALELAAGS